MAETVNTNQFKNGMHIELEGGVWRIVEFQHVKPGKGPAFVRSKLKNVGTGAVIDKTFRAGEKVRPIHTESRKMQYLYESGDEVVLMDTGDYEQISLSKSLVGDSLDWIMPNDEVDVLFVDGGPSDVQVPSAVELTVTQTDPGVRGDTASGGGNKPATLESGVVVQVPLFVNTGDRVRVDTRSREYVARV
jgi:elongation factor P